jgi:hypothetical protein
MEAAMNGSQEVQASQKEMKTGISIIWFAHIWFEETSSVLVQSILASVDQWTQSVCQERDTKV